MIHQVSQTSFPTDNFKKYTKKTNPKTTILEILVYKIQFIIHYFWLYFVYQNFQNEYFRISLFSISQTHYSKLEQMY